MLTTRPQGFILLPVVMAIALIAGVAFLMNRDGAGNVNQLGGEIAATQAGYVANAGINQMLWQANNSNCTGYTNASNISFGTNTFSGTISPTSNSPVSISVTANQAQGASYSIKRDRVKIYQPTITKTLQLGTDPGMDTYISSLLSTNNYGIAGEGVSKIGSILQNQLIQFDVSKIPSSAKIVSATLQLYQNSSTAAATVSAHRIINSWVEGTKNGSGTADGATWKTSNGSTVWISNGGDYGAISIANTSISNGTGIVNWDISSLVQNWVSGKYANNGLLLNTSDNVIASFASKEDATAANRPKLVITYTCECGVSCTNCIAGNFRDDFTSGAYTGNQGSLTWTGNWLEVGEADGAGSGKLSVTSALQCTSAKCLQIRKDIATVVSLSRELNLANAVTATLTYSYNRTFTLVGGGAVTLQISKDGGATYTALKSYALDVIDVFPVAESIDISDYATAQTRIRFVTSGASFQSFMYIDNVDVTVNCTPPPASSHSITLNPVADADISSANTGTNYGSSPEVWVGISSAGKTFKSLLKFNVTSIPATAIVTSAKLRLFSTASSGSGSMQIAIYKIIANWSESTATWTNFSNLTNYGGMQLATINAPLANPVVVEWSLPTSLINEWRDNVPTPNYGLALFYTGFLNGTYLYFASKENAATALSPQLEIDYTVP